MNASYGLLLVFLATFVAALYERRQKGRWRRMNAHVLIRSCLARRLQQRLRHVIIIVIAIIELIYSAGELNIVPGHFLLPGCPVGHFEFDVAMYIE